MEPSKPDFEKMLQEGKLTLQNGKTMFLDSDEFDDDLTEHEKKNKSMFKLFRQSMR